MWSVGVATLIFTLQLYCVTAQPRARIEPAGNLCVKANTTEVVKLVCVSDNDDILWRVGSRQIADRMAEVDGVIVNTTDRDGGGFTSTIIFTPSFLAAMTGETLEVACQAVVTRFEVVDADTTRLYVFDEPPSPEDVMIIPTSQSLQYTVQWRKPAAVKMCGDVLTYRLTVTNVDTMTTVLPSMGVLEESYVYTDRQSDECNVHQFDVVMLVGPYPSPPSSIRETLPISPNVDNMNIMATPVFGGEDIAIEVTFDPATTCNMAVYPIQNYTITILEIPSVNDTVDHTGQPVTLNLSSPLIKPNNYLISVVACISFGCHSPSPVPVFTSEVLNSSITFLNTTVSLTCVFSTVGSAIGCRFILELPSEEMENIDNIDITRPEGGGEEQMCFTTQNTRNAYSSIVVVALDSEGNGEELKQKPHITVTNDLDVILPCEPEVVTEIVEKSTLSDGEIAAIIIAVVIVFVLLVILVIAIVWWKRQSIATAYKNWVHPLTDEEGIDLMLEETTLPQSKPTIMMLMNNLVPGKSSTTTTVAAVNRQRSVTREFSHQPDNATGVKSTEAAEMSMMNSGKEPVAAIKVKDPEEPNTLQLMLKPATLANVVRIWRSKVNAGKEMLLYWKEDEEDVDNDPYYNSDEDDA